MLSQLSVVAVVEVGAEVGNSHIKARPDSVDNNQAFKLKEIQYPEKL